MDESGLPPSATPSGLRRVKVRWFISLQFANGGEWVKSAKEFASIEAAADEARLLLVAHANAGYEFAVRVVMK